MTPANIPPAVGAETDRRSRRSTDPLVALHYQLSATRTRAALDAIVVADASGVVVAGAGSWPVCEELAAYAPLLRLPCLDDGSSRVESLREEVAIRTIWIGGQEVLLCARRHGSVEVNLDDTAAGVSRILEAA